MIRVLLGVCVLNCKYDVNLGLEEVLYAYSIKRHKLGRYYLVVDAKSLQLVTNLPTQARTSLKKMYYFLVLKGVLGPLCSRSFE